MVTPKSFYVNGPNGWYDVLSRGSLMSCKGDRNPVMDYALLTLDEMREIVSLGILSEAERWRKCEEVFARALPERESRKPLSKEEQSQLIAFFP